MKKNFLFLSIFFPFIYIQAQVTTETIFQVSELNINQVSGDGIYTIAGDGSGENGYLAVVHEDGTVEEKNFPANHDYGDTWNANVYNTAIINGVVFAYGHVASSTTNSWAEIRQYKVQDSIYNTTHILKNTGVLLIENENGLFANVVTYGNSDTGSWGLELSSNYLVKINQDDLSLDWAYKLPTNWEIEWGSHLQNVTDRYIIQELPNGNIAVKVLYFPPEGWDDAKWELWEFDPADGHNEGTILTGFEPNPDDPNGDSVYLYRYHTWKIIDGKIYDEKWDKYDDDDDEDGHMTIYETEDPYDGVPWADKAWERAAVTDWGTNDLFRKKMLDWVSDETGVHDYTVYLGPELGHIKKEGVSGITIETGEVAKEIWYDEENFLLVRVYNSDQEYTKVYRYDVEDGIHTERVTLNAEGEDVVEVRDDSFFSMETESWEEREGESTIVLTHERYQQIADDVQNGIEVQPDDSWWIIPDGFQYGGNDPIQISLRPSDEGKLYFRMGVWNSSDNSELILRAYLEDGDNPYLAVTEENIAGLQVYPNPARNWVQIKADVPVVQIDFYDSTGKKVLSTTQTYISTAQLSKGVYTVKILDNRANIAVKKLVIR